MRLRRGRRLLSAVAGGCAIAFVALVALVVHGAPASARVHHASDGSAGRPKASSSSLLGLQVGGVPQATLDVGPVHVDTSRLVREIARTVTSGHARHSRSPSRRSPAQPGHSGNTSRPPSPPVHRHVAPAPRAAHITAVAQRGVASSRTVIRRQHARSRRQHATGTPRGSRHHQRRTVASSIFDPVRPGSPAQILAILVLMCGVGTALVVSLGRRREPKSVRVKASDRRR